MLAHWLGCFEWLDWCVLFVCNLLVRFLIWCSLWELWVVLLVVGVHFGSSHSPLGSIFEVLGVFWVAFWELWGSLWLHFERPGGLRGALGGSAVAQRPPGAQDQIFPNFPLPSGAILDHF